jgi:hypothetical protein
MQDLRNVHPNMVVHSSEVNRFNDLHTFGVELPIGSSLVNYYNDESDVLPHETRLTGKNNVDDTIRIVTPNIANSWQDLTTGNSFESLKVQKCTGEWTVLTIGNEYSTHVVKDENGDIIKDISILFFEYLSTDKPTCFRYEFKNYNNVINPHGYPITGMRVHESGLAITENDAFEEVKGDDLFQIVLNADISYTYQIDDYKLANFKFKWCTLSHSNTLVCAYNSDISFKGRIIGTKSEINIVSGDGDFTIVEYTQNSFVKVCNFNQCFNYQLEKTIISSLIDSITHGNYLTFINYIISLIYSIFNSWVSTLIAIVLVTILIVIVSIIILTVIITLCAPLIGFIAPVIPVAMTVLSTSYWLLITIINVSVWPIKKLFNLFSNIFNNLKKLINTSKFASNRKGEISNENSSIDWSKVKF